MADIRDLLGGGGPPGGGAPPGGTPPQQATPAGQMPKPGGPPNMMQGGGMISQLMKATGGEGLKKMATVGVAIARKLMEIVLPVFGSHTEEGKEVLKAIGAIGKMTKGVEVGDMSSLLQSLNSMLPPGIKPSGQGDLGQMLAQLSKGGAQGTPPPGATPPPGGAPPPGAMPPKPMM